MYGYKLPVTFASSAYWEDIFFEIHHFDSDQLLLCFNNLQNANLAWVTNRNTNFLFLTKQNPDSANPISYIFLCPSIVFVAQFIMNSNPSFILSKLNTCLASQITRNMSVMMMILTWVHSRGCSHLSNAYVLCMKASIVTPMLEIWGDAYQLKHQLTVRSEF